jgi:uncharacterized membrane protein YdfJ with MMPL/SSD domain
VGDSGTGVGDSGITVGVSGTTVGVSTCAHTVSLVRSDVHRSAVIPNVTKMLSVLLCMNTCLPYSLPATRIPTSSPRPPLSAGSGCP